VGLKDSPCHSATNPRGVEGKPKIQLQTNPRGVEGVDRWTGKPIRSGCYRRTLVGLKDADTSPCQGTLVGLQTNPRGVEGRYRRTLVGLKDSDVRYRRTLVGLKFRPSYRQTNPRGVEGLLRSKSGGAVMSDDQTNPRGSRSNPRDEPAWPNPRKLQTNPRGVEGEDYRRTLVGVEGAFRRGSKHVTDEPSWG